MVKNAARSAVHGARAEHEEGRKMGQKAPAAAAAAVQAATSARGGQTDGRGPPPPPSVRRTKDARTRREGGKSSCWKKDPIDPSKNACPPFMKRSPDREMECLLNQTRHNKTTKARSTTGFVLMTMCQNVLLVWFFCLFSALRYVCEYHM